MNKMEKKIQENNKALDSYRNWWYEDGESAYAWFVVDRRADGYDRRDLEVWEHMGWRICECEDNKLHGEVCQQ